ncbi:MAG: hypothetical protein V4559_12530 [Pseudomonadota bacterium]
MRNRFSVAIGVGLALLLIGPAMAKPARHAHRAHGERHSTQPYYDYRSAGAVREEFADAPRGRWMRSSRDGYFEEHVYRERREVVENLRGDFTGGVGYGADGGAFVDGYGQAHYFVGSFRRMNPLPHGPYMPRRAAPHGRGF